MSNKSLINSIEELNLALNNAKEHKTTYEMVLAITNIQKELNKDGVKISFPKVEKLQDSKLPGM